MDDALRERVEALERAVTDGDHDLSAFAEEAEAVERLQTLESRAAEFDDRIEELEAATQALRGYVGNVRSVNADVEQRADAALAKVESLEASISEADPNSPTATDAADDATGGNHAPSAGRNTTSRQEPRRSDGASAGPNERAAAPERPDLSPGAGTTQTSPTQSDPDHCASCGRPHTTTNTQDCDRSAGSDPARSSGSLDGGVAGRTQRVTETGEPTPEADRMGGAHGVPTVESLAAEDDSTTPNDDAEFGEGDELVPDGDADPLVGTADAEDAGTLQRIRDLL